MERDYSVGKKILFVFLGFVALPAAELLQIVVSLPTIMVVLAKAAAENPGSIKSILQQFLRRLLDGTLNDAVSVVYAAAAIVGFGLWFFFVFRKDHGPILRGRHFSIGALLGILIFVVGLQFLCEIVVMGTEKFIPGALEQYEELMELAGFNEPSPLIYLYGILIGPIAEELIFRGVMLHYFKRAMPFFLANILQAVLFGIYHLNIVQGVYAFVMGMIFGAVMRTGRSIFYSILAHISFNALGFTEVLNYGADTWWYYYLWMPVMVLCLVLGLILYFERMNRVNAAVFSPPR
ncbi:MAG: CPBP family intramembrane metalloprotease [Lachnospiraceae bacterium]|nr:CPBP family intramembrane metalloprotease [Lachnospiraceae bacterium]